MRYLTIALLLILFSCAQSTEIVAPSGDQGFAIDCNSAYTSMSDCYKKASEVCPAGYTVESKDTDEHMANRSLVISCKESKKQAQESADLTPKSPVMDKGCMDNQDCPKGEVCASVRGEFPGSCAKKGLGI